MGTRKAFLIEDKARGYFMGIDYIKNCPCFSRDVESAKDFDTLEQAENNLIDMDEDMRDVKGTYGIVSVIIVY